MTCIGLVNELKFDETLLSCCSSVWLHLSDAVLKFRIVGVRVFCRSVVGQTEAVMFQPSCSGRYLKESNP